MMGPRLLGLTALPCVLLIGSACALIDPLGVVIQPPRFVEAKDQPAEITIHPPTAARPLGGAAIRLWTEVTNPNPFGLTLGTLDGTLFLEGTRAAGAAFPLGLPLGARQQSVVPIDLSISFADLPGLADVVRSAARREPVAYRLEGTIGVDAGQLGQPVFGPMTFLSGDLRAR
jgi:hypothetical protein